MEQAQKNFMESGIAYESIAQVCHEANKNYCRTIGDFSQVSWEDAPAWQKESAINGVKFHFLNDNTTAADSHNSWLKEKTENGWKYGEIKNEETKEHPCFTAYENLPTSQQRKDYIFKGIVDAFKNAYSFNVIKLPTFGELAVGFNFNPSGSDKVGKAKKLMADAIDLLEEVHVNETKATVSWTRNVFRTAAFNAIIAAQMALVKYITWKD
jgi:hypothetical protein